MTAWEIANELYIAKKCYDSIWYLDQYKNLIICPTEKRQIYSRRFFIQLATFFEKCEPNKQLRYDIQKSDNIIEKIKYERDKNSAHTDDDYDVNHTPKDLSSLYSYITYLYNYYKHKLPSTFTLDFICYDKSLYREINKIDPKSEKLMHPIHYYLPKIRDEKSGKIPNISEEHLYVDEFGSLHLQSGLTDKENIQNMQDFLMYCHINFYNPQENTWWDKETILKNIHGTILDKPNKHNLEEN